MVSSSMVVGESCRVGRSGGVRRGSVRGDECLPLPYATSKTTCQPPGGAACPCPDRFKDAKSLCWVENDAGICLSEHTCDTTCPAATPQAETCNGLDDDCDNLTDEGLPDCS